MSELEDKLIKRHLDEVDREVTGWMARNGLPFLRSSLGVIFLWFGGLKFFPGLSPEEILIQRSLWFINPFFLMPALAIVEGCIGLGLLLNRFKRLTLLLLFVQMGGTLLPLLLLPDMMWYEFPYAPSLHGQYIIKNLVLIGAGMVIGATVRGGRLTCQ